LGDTSFTQVPTVHQAPKSICFFMGSGVLCKLCDVDPNREEEKWVNGTGRLRRVVG